MRIPVILFSLLCCFAPTAYVQAADPGAQQDAEAAREKLLKAEDQLENIQANSETTKTAVDNMKADVSKLQADVLQLQNDNASLKQQLTDLRTAFDKAEAAHAKERQVLIDSVADLIKQQSSGTSKPTPKKKPEKTAPSTTTPAPAKTPDADASASPSTNPSASTLTPPADPAPAPTEPPPAKPQKGYYHIVASGETLRLICNAYRQDGVNVSVSDIQKANGLTDKSVLKVGQKLFIPKPGT